MSRRGCAAIIALILGAVSAADAALCQGKGGRVFVRDACRKRERAIDPGGFGASGPPGADGTPGDPGDPAAFPLRLLDANGVEVGAVVNFYPVAALVRITSANVPTALLFYVVPSGFQMDNGALYYQSNDCSGVPYMKPTVVDSTLVIPPVAAVYGAAAYYSTAALQSVMYASQEFVPNGGAACPGGSTATTRESCCSSVPGSTSNVVPATRVALSLLALTPPFRAVPR